MQKHEMRRSDENFDKYFLIFFSQTNDEIELLSKNNINGPEILIECFFRSIECFGKHIDETQNNSSFKRQRDVIMKLSRQALFQIMLYKISKCFI
jgi:hypothetical protein